MKETFHLSSSYFARRLAEARRAPDLHPSIAYDLARSPFSDDELEAATEALGAPSHDTTIGFADVMDELLSREPRTVAVDDLTAMQTQLREQGYVSPETPIDGVWGPTWSAAKRRAWRDGYESAQGGNTLLSAPPIRFLTWISHTIPSSVWKGVVGAAKGVAEEAPETIDRLGLLAGTAGLPGVLTKFAGFLGDFFGDDEDDEAKSATEELWNAVTPFEDYRGRDGAKLFFEDMGVILTAASLVTGVTGAARATVSGVRAASAGGGLRATLAANPVGTAPGLIARGTAAVTRPVSSRGADFFLNASRYVRGNPLMKSTREAFTPLSQANLVARGAGGFGSGDDTTAIEKAIEDAPRLPGADVIDWTVGLAIYPTKLLPGNLGKAAKSIDASMNNAGLEPYVHVAQKRLPDGSFPTHSQARERALNFLGSTPAERAASNAFYRLNFGIGQEAAVKMRKLGRIDDPHTRELRFIQAKSSIVRRIYDEAGEAATAEEILGKSATAKRAAEASLHDPAGFKAYLDGIEGIGSSLERGGAYREAAFTLQDASQQGLISVGKGKGQAPRIEDFSVYEMRKKSVDLEAQAKKLERQASTGQGLSTNERIEAKTQAAALREEAKKLRDQAAKPKTRKSETLTAIPVRKYDPSRNDPGYATREDVLELADEWKGLTGRLRHAEETIDAGGFTSPDVELAARRTFQETQEAVNTFARDLEFRGLIDSDTAAAAMVPKPPVKIAQELKRVAKLRGQRANVPEEVAARLDELGYQAVVTGEDVVQLSDVPRILEATGVSDYAARHKFYAGVKSMGLGPKMDPDKRLGEMRFAATMGELHQVLGEAGVKMTGKQAVNALSKRLERGRTLREGVAAKGPFVIETGKKLPRIPKVDLRQLTLDDIVDGLQLETRTDADPFDVAAKVYEGIHRGATFGGEISLTHPREMLSQVGKAMRVDGLQGFANFMRTAHLPTPKKFAKGNYGYLPEKATNTVLAFRYALSPMFDTSRMLEQNMMGAFKGEGAIPMMLRPKKKVMQRTFERSPFSSGAVSGEQAWKDAGRFYDEIIMERNVLGPIDELERRFEAVGILGFNPKDWERAQGWFLYQQAAAKGDVTPAVISEIREKLLTIGRYGTGRSALEKSVHFVFFPFSFQKKLYGAMADWTTSAPVRNLLVHEGARRLNELSESGKLKEFSDRWLPIAEQLGQLNNFAYGLSPGRFLLEGVKDRETTEAKAVEYLTAFFAPGGSLTPLHQATGMTTDAVKNLFVPVALDESGVRQVLKAADRIIPAVQDVSSFASGVVDTAEAATQGGAKYWQLRNYLEEKKAASAFWEPVAEALDNPSASALIQAQLDAAEIELGRKYPVGEKMAGTFTNDAQVKKRLLLDIAQDPDRSEAEDEIHRLVEMVETAKGFAEVLGMSQTDAAALLTHTIRKEALKQANDKEFVRLWETFLADDYGPLRMIAA